jgi:hypothetical protein
MTSSSFQTENLNRACQCWYSDRREGEYALLDVLGHARHQVLAVLVQALGLFCVLVGGVDNGNMETALSASLGVLMQKSILEHGSVTIAWVSSRTLMFGKSETSAASSFWRRAETVKARVEGATLREARRRERVADCRKAILCVFECLLSTMQ